MKPPAAKKKHTWVLWGIVLILLGSLLVFYNYLLYLQKQHDQAARLPLIRPIAQSIDLVEREGQSISVPEDLKGKVWVAGYLFTRCISGCAGNAARMSQIQEDLQGLEDLQFVCFSVDPEHDTPDTLKAFASAHGIDVSNFWFLTGDPELLPVFMNKNFQFQSKRQTDPQIIAEQGLYIHDMRLALVDRQGVIRGYYDIMQGDYIVDNLMRDIKTLYHQSTSQD